MYFILSGRVGIMANLGDGRSTRLRSVGRFTTVGEMGLVSDQPRSATLEAEMPSVVCVLTRENYRAILCESPALAQALLSYFMSVTAERLMFANRTITALRR
jgi:SulP family sulfate permease